MAMRGPFILALLVAVSLFPCMVLPADVPYLCLLFGSLPSGMLAVQPQRWVSLMWPWLLSEEWPLHAHLCPRFLWPLI